jgi:hypothetical protein
MTGVVEIEISGFITQAQAQTHKHKHNHEITQSYQCTTIIPPLSPTSYMDPPFPQLRPLPSGEQHTQD